MNDRLLSDMQVGVVDYAAFLGMLYDSIDLDEFIEDNSWEAVSSLDGSELLEPERQMQLDKWLNKGK